jgi:hypothetical protein
MESKNLFFFSQEYATGPHSECEQDEGNCSPSPPPVRTLSLVSECIVLRMIIYHLCYRLDGTATCTDFSSNIDRCNITALF